MARAEFILLLFLGFSVGLLLFMYMNVKRDLYKVRKENQVLHKNVFEYVSDTKTSLFKKSLAESDLKRSQENNQEDDDRIKELNLQLKKLEMQLVRCWQDHVHLNLC